MKAGHAHVTLVVDRSGSMEEVMPAAGEGVNEFIGAHKSAAGTCSFFLVEFDDVYDVVYGPGDIQAFAGPYNLVPRNMTSLLDAVGKAINTTGDYLSKLGETERPEKIIFVVQTDGQENSSKEFTWQAVQDMVKHQTDVYAWEFLFLGADLSQAQGMGIGSSYSNRNTRASYARTFNLAAAATVASRGLGAKGMSYGNRTVDADGNLV